MGRLRLTTDGTPRNTHVVDLETGKEIQYVRSVSFSMDANSFGVMILEVENVAAVIEVEDD